MASTQDVMSQNIGDRMMELTHCLLNLKEIQECRNSVTTAMDKAIRANVSPRTQRIRESNQFRRPPITSPVSVVNQLPIQPARQIQMDNQRRDSRETPINESIVSGLGNEINKGSLFPTLLEFHNEMDRRTNRTPSKEMNYRMNEHDIIPSEKERKDTAGYVIDSQIQTNAHNLSKPQSLPFEISSFLGTETYRRPEPAKRFVDDRMHQNRDDAVVTAHKMDDRLSQTLPMLFPSAMGTAMPFSGENDNHSDHHGDHPQSQLQSMLQDLDTNMLNVTSLQQNQARKLQPQHDKVTSPKMNSLVNANNKAVNASLVGNLHGNGAQAKLEETLRDNDILCQILEKQEQHITIKEHRIAELEVELNLAQIANRTLSDALKTYWTEMKKLQDMNRALRGQTPLPASLPIAPKGDYMQF